jgi:hypothetical protein
MRTPVNHSGAPDDAGHKPAGELSSWRWPGGVVVLLT